MPNSTSASDNPSKAPPPNRPRPRRRSLPRFVALCCGGLFALLPLAWAALLTPAGLRAAAGLAEAAIHAASGMTATIRDVSGVLPVSLRV
ncbi:MAG TPA: hypothetical protein PKD41_18080, partial [Solidesulfovibrio sp.]|nr:hypothetical protein [Solidesulfovibrio sp.]